jgi:hypothetical protein
MPTRNRQGQKLSSLYRSVICNRQQHQRNTGGHAGAGRAGAADHGELPVGNRALSQQIMKRKTKSESSASKQATRELGILNRRAARLNKEAIDVLSYVSTWRHCRKRNHRDNMALVAPEALLRPVSVPSTSQTLNSLLKGARRRNVILESADGERFVLAPISD